MDDGVAVDRPAQRFLVKPSDFKRMPRFVVPTSQGLYGDQVETPAPHYLVPLSSVREPGRTTGSQHLADAREEALARRGQPGAYEPLYGNIPVNSGAETSAPYGYRVLPPIALDSLPGSEDAHSPIALRVPVMFPSHSRPSNLPSRYYDQEQLWIPRQIPSRMIEPPIEEARTPELRRQVGAAPVSGPPTSSRPFYGHPTNYEDEASPYLPYPVPPSRDYMDSRYPLRVVPTQRRPWNVGDGSKNVGDSPYFYARSNEQNGGGDRSSFSSASAPYQYYQPPPGYMLVPCGDAGDYNRPNPDYVPLDGADSFSKASGGYRGGYLDRRPSEVPPKQASVEPVDFPVSDLAIVKPADGEGRDHSLPSTAYDNLRGRIPVHDPRHATVSSTSTPFSPSTITTPNTTRGVPMNDHNAQDFQDDHAFDNTSWSKGRQSNTPWLLKNNTPFPPGSGSALPSREAADDHYTLTKPPSAKEVIGLGSPFIPRVIPVQSSASLPGDTSCDDQCRKVQNPVYLRPLEGPDKIQEVLDDDAVITTRVIPVSWPESNVSEGSKSNHSGPLNDAVQSKLSELSKCSNTGPSGDVGQSVRKSSKLQDDLLARMGKAIWSAKSKQRKSATEEAGKSEKHAGIKDTISKAPVPHHDLLSRVTKATVSQTNSASQNQAKSHGKEEQRSTGNVEGITAGRNCPETFKSDQNFSAPDGDPVQEFKMVESGHERAASAKEHVARPVGEERIVVHEDLHPSFSILQQLECANNAANDVDAQPVLVEVDKKDGELPNLDSTSEEKSGVAGADGNIQEGAENLETSKVQEVLGNNMQRTEPLSLEDIVTRLQAKYRGNTVRRAGLLKSLRFIQEVRSKLRSLQSQICSSKDAAKLLESPKERVKTTESAMALLLELDTLQGVHPVAREMRKLAAHEIVMFQDWLDAVLKGQVELPSTTSVDNMAEPPIATCDDLQEVGDSNLALKEEVSDVDSPNSFEPEPEPDSMVNTEEELLNNAADHGLAKNIAGLSEDTMAGDIGTEDMRNQSTMTSESVVASLHNGTANDDSQSPGVAENETRNLGESSTVETLETVVATEEQADLAFDADNSPTSNSKDSGSLTICDHNSTLEQNKYVSFKKCVNTTGKEDGASNEACLENDVKPIPTEQSVDIITREDSTACSGNSIVVDAPDALEEGCERLLTNSVTTDATDFRALEGSPALDSMKVDSQDAREDSASVSAEKDLARFCDDDAAAKINSNPPLDRFTELDTSKANSEVPIENFSGEDNLNSCGEGAGKDTYTSKANIEVPIENFSGEDNINFCDNSAGEDTNTVNSTKSVSMESSLGIDTWKVDDEAHRENSVNVPTLEVSADSADDDVAAELNVISSTEFTLPGGSPVLVTMNEDHEAPTDSSVEAPVVKDSACSFSDHDGTANSSARFPYVSTSLDCHQIFDTVQTDGEAVCEDSTDVNTSKGTANSAGKHVAAEITAMLPVESMPMESYPVGNTMKEEREVSHVGEGNTKERNQHGNSTVGQLPGPSSATYSSVLEGESGGDITPEIYLLDTPQAIGEEVEPHSAMENEGSTSGIRNGGEDGELHCLWSPEVLLTREECSPEAVTKDSKADKARTGESSAVILAGSSQRTEENFAAESNGKFRFDEQGKTIQTNDEDVFLVRELVEENKKLQMLLKEVIQSNSEHNTTIRAMLDRLEKLEEVVKDQGRRKEKRHKHKKNY